MLFVTRELIYHVCPEADEIRCRTKVRDGNGNCGLVPTSYIELSYQNSGYAQEILRAGLSASAGAVNHPGASSAGPAVGRRYVLFEYTANDNQEISVQEGDIVEVLEDVDGWLMVRNAQGLNLSYNLSQATACLYHT